LYFLAIASWVNVKPILVSLPGFSSVWVFFVLRRLRESGMFRFEAVPDIAHPVVDCIADTGYTLAS